MEISAAQNSNQRGRHGQPALPRASAALAQWPPYVDAGAGTSLSNTEKQNLPKAPAAVRRKSDFHPAYGSI